MTEGILNQTDQPIAAEDTTTIEQESLVPYPVINTQDTKPHNNMDINNPEHLLHESKKGTEDYEKLVNSMDKVTRTLTFGEKAVGISFNPSNNQQVEAIKQGFANVIDILNLYRTEAESQEAKRMLSVAITDAQAAQMWAVKAVTWQY